jgi:hypothetical protein
LLTKTFGMEGNRIMEQINAIFSTFMVFFYLGIGIYLLFYFESQWDKALVNLMGGTFVFFGIFRAFRAYAKIVEAFFTGKNEE